jgi:hypothetical protein
MEFVLIFSSALWLGASASDIIRQSAAMLEINMEVFMVFGFSSCEGFWVLG